MMSAVTITFKGGPDTGNVGGTTWGTPKTGEIEFPLREPVTLDPATARNAPHKAFIEHVIRKARANPYFDVEEASVSKKAEEPKDGEPVEIPEDWADLHHATKIKLARDLGADVSSQVEAEEAIEAELKRRNG
jgi:hypothetical protein